MRPLVIGSGVNGLAAAFYLAKTGLKPLVLEQADDVGGGTVSREIHPGFLAPVLSHEVLLHESIVRDMNLRAHGLELVSSDVELCAPALDGPAIVIHADVARASASIAARSPRDGAAWARFRATLDRLAGVIAPVLTTPPPDIDSPQARDLWALLRAGHRFRGLGRRDAFRMLRWLPMPVFDFVHEWFDDDLLRAVVAAPGLSGTMYGPRSAGSTLVALLRHTHAHLAGGRPLRARGGPGACTRAMAAAARAAGAEVQTGARVERILTRQGQVTGVVVDGREIAASLVVSAVDPKTTLLSMVDPQDLSPDISRKVRNIRAAGTVAKVNLALSALPGFTNISDVGNLTGTVHLGERLDDLERAFDHAKYGELSSTPWLNVEFPSLVDPVIAPPGQHVASIYVHYAPRTLRAGPWRQHRDALLRVTLETLERYAPGVSSLVLATDVLTPEDIEQRTGAWGGHIFHGELAPDQLFTMRPLLGMARYDSPIGGLHLCSAGTHPGGFGTGASGRLAALAVSQQAGRRAKNTG